MVFSSFQIGDQPSMLGGQLAVLISGHYTSRNSTRSFNCCSVRWKFGIWRRPGSPVRLGLDPRLDELGPATLVNVPRLRREIRALAKQVWQPMQLLTSHLLAGRDSRRQVCRFVPEWSASNRRSARGTGAQSAVPQKKMFRAMDLVNVPLMEPPWISFAARRSLGRMRRRGETSLG